MLLVLLVVSGTDIGQILNRYLVRCWDAVTTHICCDGHSSFLRCPDYNLVLFFLTLLNPFTYDHKCSHRSNEGKATSRLLTCNLGEDLYYVSCFNILGGIIY